MGALRRAGLWTNLHPTRRCTITPARASQVVHFLPGVWCVFGPALTVAFARAWAADQDDILGVFHEGATVQLTDGGFVDLAGFEVKTCEVLVGREARHLGLVGD